MDAFQITLALMGLAGFVIPIFFIIGQDTDGAVADPSLEEMEQRQRRDRDDE